MPKAAPSVDKLRGGFYTPITVARFLANWAITPSVKTVLEPSCGDSRPWLIEAAVLATAGGYQFTPLKRRFLAACRRPGDHVMSPALVGADGVGANAIRLGLHHGLDCLGSSGALMLVMFASGFASFWTMAALTILMVYEATGRNGERAATAAGVVLLLAALTVLSGPLPGVA